MYLCDFGCHFDHTQIEVVRETRETLVLPWWQRLWCYLAYGRVGFITKRQRMKLCVPCAAAFRLALHGE